MSSSVGDPDESENDSEVNYIADYMTEVEDDGAPERDVDVAALMKNGSPNTTKSGESKKPSWNCLEDAWKVTYP